MKINPSPAETPIKSAHYFRMRALIVYLGIGVGFLAIAFRLLQLQILKNPNLENLAQKQFEREGKTAPYRMAIFDRNREELAVSIPSSSIFARPRLVTRKRKAAQVFAKLLGDNQLKWLQKLQSGKSFVWIQRQLEEETIRPLSKYNLPGVFLQPENKRVYPNGMLASQLLGFTDIDGNGLSGIEHTLNQELLRRETRFSLPRDGKGNPSYLDQKYLKPDDGKAGVYITIDRRIQHIVEEELELALRAHSAKSVMAVVMDPHTGEIFAMGQRPSFDPNSFSKFPNHSYNSQLISHVYEPGSVMKPIFAAEALELGLMTPASLIDCENGFLQIGNKKIGEAESTHRYGIISFEKVLRFSSNVGAVKIADLLGQKRMVKALEKFGLIQKTGVHLSGEISGNVKREEKWVPFYQATVGFGQGIAVTPLQMVAAFAPFANGGYWVRPRILLREGMAEDKEDVKRVLSPKTVRMMNEILTSATEEKNATGVLAKVPGIRVAGKTGTAQKYDSKKGYEAKKYFSSFIGYLPSDKPELLVGVMIDEPEDDYYASKVAAPLFKTIAERSLQVLDRIPKRTLAAVGVTPHSSSIVEVKPIVGAIELTQTQPGKWIMPDLKGLSVRESLRILGKVNDNLSISGTGQLVKQEPQPGRTFSQNSKVALQFSEEIK